MNTKHPKYQIQTNTNHLKINHRIIMINLHAHQQLSDGKPARVSVISNQNSIES